MGEHLVQCFLQNKIAARIFEAERERLLPNLSDQNALARLGTLLRSEMKEQPFTLLHPGTSCWADRPELAILAEELGFTLIAPPPRVVSLFSSKLSFLSAAEKYQLPSLVLSLEPLHTLREIERFLEDEKFPIVLKSARGLGGGGICVLHSEEDVLTKLELWLEQLRVNQGEIIVFPERYLEGGRIVSLPFARVDGEGTQFFPLIDVSLQSRGRKLVQFCPAEIIAPKLEKSLQKAANQIIETSRYLGVGAIEFIVEDDQYYVLEGVARLGTSFRLWEKVAGTHALDWQLAALGVLPKPKLPAKSSELFGASFRIYAEDPLLQLPQPGLISELSTERVWSTQTSLAELHFGVEEGDEIKAQHSGILAELYSFSNHPKSVFTLAQGALEETWIAGSLQTNQRFLWELIQHPWIKEKIFHAGFVDEEFLPAIRPNRAILEVVAGIGALLDPVLPGDRFAMAGKYVPPIEESIEWTRGPEHFKAANMSGLKGEVSLLDGSTLRVSAYPLAKNRWKIRAGIWELILKKVPAGEIPLKKVSSLVPGRVHAILFREGAIIEAHNPILMVQSLGMLVPHALPVKVRILKWKVSAEEFVNTGQELADFEVID